MQELDTSDSEEEGSEQVVIDKEKVQQELKKLKARKEKYQLLEAQLKQIGEDQISTTDGDSRGLLLHRHIVEVSYNVQMTVDAEHNLLVHVEATNSSDRNALHTVAREAKAVVQKESIILLADKGYHNGRELHRCA